MPIYEYLCSNCGSEFEKLTRFSDPNVNSPECPKCKSYDTNKRLSKIAAMNNSSGTLSSGGSCGSSGGFS